MWKDNNICYENFHHISVPGSINAFIYGIYRIQFLSVNGERQ